MRPHHTIGLQGGFLYPQEKLNELEADLGQHRGSMPLGYKNADGEFQKGSSVQLSNTIKTNPDEAVRKAAWEVRQIPYLHNQAPPSPCYAFCAPAFHLQLG